MESTKPAATDARAPRGRLTLLLVIGFFFLPQCIAALLYYGGWKPHALVNHGQLIRPVRPIRDVSLRALDGADFRFSALRGKWLMVYFGPAVCGNACVHDLYKMRQVRIAQGDNADRLRRLFVVTNGRGLGHLRTLLKSYPGMNVATGPAAAVASLSGQFALDHQLPALDNRIYLVDPLGNLMMSYPPDADPEGMLKDLQRLMKVSQVG